MNIYQQAFIIFLGAITIACALAWAAAEIFFYFKQRKL